MSTPLVPVKTTIDNTLGAILVGFAVSCCVYGILVTHVWVYFSRFPDDRPVYKFLVALIMVMETADQALIGHIVYYYGISNFDNPTALIVGTVTWSFILQQTFGAIVGAIVKTAFSLRVWRFSQRNYYITAIALLLTLGQLGLAITFTIKAFQLPGVFAVVELRVLGTTALGVGVLTDLFIAGALCFFLSRLRTGYHQSDTLVNTLVRYAINTGVFTATVSTATVVMYNIMPNNLIFIGTYFLLSKLYAISFMTTLNTRRVVRGKGTDRQFTTSNQRQSTNMFHLGTRMPSMGPHDLAQWNAPDSKESEFHEMQAFPPPRSLKYLEP
ncbi:hypothetical protein C8J56DRAFT_198969 [Mycena floridula]|nr:hypothetical protein C8J56DRAFT_198969 [Mycena floridula]